MAEETDVFADFNEVDFESVVDAETAAKAVEMLASESAEPPPEIPNPLDGPVTLPGGFRRLKGSSTWENVTTAWVRELNGHDEERIARARMRDDLDSWIQTILESGVEKLGDETPTKDDLRLLTIGDRDFLLLEIARATYGDQIEYESVRCTTCGETFGMSFSLSEDVPVTRLDSVDDLTFEVKLSRDRVAVVNLPTVEVAPALAKTDTAAEANTILLTHSVQEIRGGGNTIQVAGDKDAVLSLGVRDRQAILSEMSAKMPGPRYNGIKFEHDPGCGGENRFAISLEDLFRGL